MSNKSTIKPCLMLVVDTSNIYNITFVVVDTIGKIIHMSNVVKNRNYYKSRKNILQHIEYILEQYAVDTILIERNKLFIDKIDKYPDPYVLRDVMLGFGIQVSIEDKYYESLNILALPEYEWKNIILGKNQKYVIDLYKSHIMHRTDIPLQYFTDIESNNYYKAICLSESILFDNLMNKKYQINKGD